MYEVMVFYREDNDRGMETITLRTIPRVGDRVRISPRMYRVLDVTWCWDDDPEDELVCVFLKRLE